MFTKKIKSVFLSWALSRELLFFLFRKKVYRKWVDRKIVALIYGKRNLSARKTANLVVSLTTFPKRIHEVKYALFSILDQTLLPEKIILWLAEEEFPDKETELPEDLTALQKYNFEIRWCHNIRSYKKLIPALESFPDYYIVTADDDIYYQRNWLEKIWREHIHHPKDLICHLAHRITFDHQQIAPYRRWKKSVRRSDAGPLNFGCSGGGILYCRQYLYEDITRQDLFLSLAPHADDVWFYVMTVLNKTAIRIIKKPYNRLKYVNPYREYHLNAEYTLARINVEDNQNDQQLQQVLDYYGLDMFTLKNTGGR